MNTTLIKIYDNLGYIKLGIMILFLSAVAIYTLNLFKVRSIKGDNGVDNIIGNIKSMRSRDQFIYNSKKFIHSITRLVQLTPFAVSGYMESYLDYNLKRANVHVPGGRIMTGKEYNAILTFVTGILLILSSIICIIVNLALGCIIMFAIIIGVSILPMQILRGTVHAKDLEIQKHFADCYLMLHYILISGAKTPLTQVLKTYAKTTTSEEMIRFIDVSTNYMETYGEQSALPYIAQDYREIPEVTKLTRLIKQLYDGADIENDLLGFREELIKAKKYAITKHMDMIVKRAQFSFNLLLPILGQAIVSAMAIYFPDMMGASMFI